MRTPRAVSAGGQDRVMMEAQNLSRLQQGQTPLLGGENPQIHDSDFSGVTPKNFAAAKEQGLQALRLEPEGLQSARAQLLLADISMAQGNNVDAGKQYASIAVLFNDDPNVPVEALKKAATAYQAAGDLSMTQKMEDQLAQWQASRKK